MNKKWEALATKELKGVNVKETLVRKTNEQIFVKPLYTQEDWHPTTTEAEIPGNITNLTEIDLNMIRCISI